MSLRSLSAPFAAVGPLADSCLSLRGYNYCVTRSPFGPGQVAPLAAASSVRGLRSISATHDQQRCRQRARCRLGLRTDLRWPHLKTPLRLPAAWRRGVQIRRHGTQQQPDQLIQSGIEAAVAGLQERRGRCCTTATGRCSRSAGTACAVPLPSGCALGQSCPSPGRGPEVGRVSCAQLPAIGAWIHTGVDPAQPI